MRRLTRDQAVVELGPETPPVLALSPGERLRVETPVPRGLRMKSLGDPRPPRQIPITGPIAISGAQPGDSLRVHVHQIQLLDWGMVWTAPWLGVLDDAGLYERKLTIRDGHIEFHRGICLPVRPMIGFVGVAPADRPAPCLAVGDWGGNMDTLTVTEGATVVLPVNVAGALLALGDVHATMGEGEVLGIALEAGAELVVSVEVTRGDAPPCPMVMSAAHIAVIVTESSFEAGCRRVVRTMTEMLARRLDIGWGDAYALVGLCGDLRVSQNVNPFGTTLRLEVPRTLWERED